MPGRRVEVVKGGQHEASDASYYPKIMHEDTGKLGNYPILSVLQDKIARFLYEFHAFRIESLDLLPLPAENSGFDLHRAHEDDQVSGRPSGIDAGAFIVSQLSPDSVLYTQVLILFSAML